jgi:hypothetical protein
MIEHAPGGPGIPPTWTSSAKDMVGCALGNSRLWFTLGFGIVNEVYLLHGLANTIVDHHEPGAAKDRQLRHELVKILLDKHELDTVLVDVTVSDGNVRLWGVVENADEAAAAESAAKTMPGVKSVENNLGPGPMSGVPV